MFTGIVTDIGRVAALERGDGLLRAQIDSAYDAASMAVGASLAHDGCCHGRARRQQIGRAHV